MNRNIKDIEAENQAMKDADFNSQNAPNGYMETGNPKQAHGKERAMRHNENRGH